MPGALQHLLVLDLTSHLSGPYCAMLLADHGAEVIKIEPPSMRSLPIRTSWHAKWLCARTIRLPERFIRSASPSSCRTHRVRFGCRPLVWASIRTRFWAARTPRPRDAQCPRSFAEVTRRSFATPAPAGRDLRRMPVPEPRALGGQARTPALPDNPG
jgi:hypothetical protein